MHLAKLTHKSGITVSLSKKVILKTDLREREQIDVGVGSAKVVMPNEMDLFNRLAKYLATEAPLPQKYTYQLVLCKYSYQFPYHNVLGKN